MEKNLLRDFKGYKIYEQQIDESDVNKRKLTVDNTDIDFEFDIVDSTSLNKAIENTKTQIITLVKQKQALASENKDDSDDAIDDNIKNENIYIPEQIFSDLEHKCDLNGITEGKVKHLPVIDKKQYCLSGAEGTGKGKGWASMDAYEVVLLKDYVGKKVPLNYRDHFKEIDAGRRERGYDGLEIQCGGKNYVLIGPEKTFLPKKGKKNKKAQKEETPVRKCRVCGCTEEDCSQCIAKTGKPCTWVEKDLCSACVPQHEEKIVIPVKDSRASQQSGENIPQEQEKNIPVGDSFFFQQLAMMGNVDVNMRIMKVNGSFTIGITPGNAVKGMLPTNITGTPEEFDEGFLTTIMPRLKEIRGLVHNIKEVKESAEKKSELKSPPKKAPAKKKTSKPAPKKAIPKKKTLDDIKGKKLDDKKPAPKKSEKKAVVKKPVVKKDPPVVEQKVPAVVETSLFDQPAAQ